MLKKNFLNVFMIILMTALPLFAQQGQSANEVKRVIGKLFEFSEKNNFEAAASIIAYNGPDKDRFLNAFSDYSIAPERRRINKICKRINALLKTSNNYKIEVTRGKPNKGKQVVVAKVIFESGKRKLKINFLFTRINNKLGLIEIK